MFRQLATLIDLPDLLATLGLAMVLGVAFVIDWRLGTFLVGVVLLIGGWGLARLEAKEEEAAEAARLEASKKPEA